MARDLVLLLVGGAGILAAASPIYNMDCEVGRNHMYKWTRAKKAWCCTYATYYNNRACGDHHFDCSINPHNWMQAWSEKKKNWCCQNAHAWSDRHQGFCCARHTGCHSNAKPLRKISFDCRAGILNQKGWSDEKKQYCCSHQQIGCGPFNCRVGLQLAETGWSDSKKKWCCDREKLGCPINCFDQLDRRSWTHHKICYCCKHKGIACPLAHSQPSFLPYVPENTGVTCHGTHYQKLFEAHGAASDATDDDDAAAAAAGAAPRRWLGAPAAAGALALASGALALAAVGAGFRWARRAGRAAAGGELEDSAGLKEGFQAAEE